MDVELNPGPNLDKEIKIFHLNCRSFRNKNEYIEDIANEYDVICLTETHLDATISIDDILLPGFSVPYILDRLERSGGGILTYISDSIKHTRRFDLEYNGVECLWVQFEIPNFRLIVFTVYRPPSSANVFWTSFKNSVNR